MFVKSSQPCTPSEPVALCGTYFMWDVDIKLTHGMVSARIDDVAIDSDWQHHSHLNFVVAIQPQAGKQHGNGETQQHHHACHHQWDVSRQWTSLTWVLTLWPCRCWSRGCCRKRPPTCFGKTSMPVNSVWLPPVSRQRHWFFEHMSCWEVRRVSLCVRLHVSQPFGVGLDKRV